MTILYAAATCLVNPPGSSIFLTQDQLWAGLERKRREPQLFLHIVEACTVLVDKDDVILREVSFVPIAGGPRTTAQERVTCIKHTSSTAGAGVHTFLTVGSANRVLNIVSSGEREGDLLLTFTFEWEHPGLNAASEEAVELQRKYQAVSPEAVALTLAHIRRLVQEGEL